MLLIPAMDLLAGRCVRLYQGNFNVDIRYVRQAREETCRLEALGISWLHVVDLDGARDGLPANGPLIASLARAGQIRLQVGGGVRSAEVIEALLNAGVGRVVIGSAAVQKPVEVLQWLQRFGAERLCLGFDVRIAENGEPRVYAQGWRHNCALSLWDAISLFPINSLRHVLCTDIARSGALTGPNLALYASAVSNFPNFAWQASGGVRDATDIAALARLGVAATISGRALRENLIAVEELRQFLPDVSSSASTSATARS